MSRVPIEMFILYKHYLRESFKTEVFTNVHRSWLITIYLVNIV